MKKFFTKLFKSSRKPNKTDKLNVCLIYTYHPNPPQTVIDSLNAFKQYSSHNIIPVAYNDEGKFKILESYDVLVFHYYGQVYRRFSSFFLKKINKFKGLKVFFAQDEYDLLQMNREKYGVAGADILYSVYSEDERIQNKLYPKGILPSVQIEKYLTGYVPKLNQTPVQISQRKCFCFYRGNSLGMAYGSLGYEKIEIGKRMKKALSGAGMELDIEVCIEKQIYGPVYLQRMGEAKTTLLTESGSSILDCDFDQRLNIINEIKQNPGLDFSYFKEKYADFFQKEDADINGVIAPKAFEAIACKTAIIAYEGKYSRVLKPDVHYISLKKDWSNMADVIEKMQDDKFLQSMVDAAYRDVVLSGKFSYQRFVENFDKVVLNAYRKKNGAIH